MYYRVLKPIVFGILVGLAFFIMPFFILKVIAFFIIGGLLIRFFIFRGIRRFFKGKLFYTSFADDIRNMSDSEYQKYKQRYSNRGFTYFYGKPRGQTIEVEVK